MLSSCEFTMTKNVQTADKPHTLLCSNENIHSLTLLMHKVLSFLYVRKELKAFAISAKTIGFRFLKRSIQE